MIEPYQVVGLMPTIRGIRQRDEIQWNLDHIAHLIKAASWLHSLDLPVRLGAAQVLVSWSHAGRFRSEAALPPLAGTNPIPASSGQVTRHRLNRGGDRQLNRALHTIVLVRLRDDPDTRAYLARRTAEGNSRCDAKRCLRRAVARQLFRLLERYNQPASKSSEPLDIHSSLTPLTAPDVPRAGDVPTCTFVRDPRDQTNHAQEETMSNEAQAQQPPSPDPALRVLDRYVGTWDMKGRTLDSEEDNVTGQATFEWLPGGFFLQQRVRIRFAAYGFEIQGLEVIGYDPETRTFPSTVYPSMFGTPIPYRWEIDGDELTITTDMLGADFHGRWSADGSSFSGGWRPMPGREGPGNIAYDIGGSRAS